MKFALWMAAGALALPTLASAETAKPAGSKKPDPSLSCALMTDSGLGYTMLKAGEGDKPGADDAVSVNYTGRLTSDGTQFDTGAASQFAVMGVIPGFGEGLQLMQPGAKYRLCIPAALGYGEQEKGSIPPNSDLVFEVELLSVIKPPEPVLEYIPEAERKCEMTTASGLGYKELNSGLGNAPTDADVALVNVTIYEPGTGKVLNRSDWQQIPMPNASEGFGEGLKLMNVGSAFRFCIPGTLLGQKPAEDGTPPPTINFHVDLVDLKKLSDLR